MLRASITRDAPYYQYVTYIVYGNDAAPKLVFSRGPSKGANLEGKQLKKFVKKGANKLDEKQKRDLMDNDPTTNYTRLGNDEFEVLFGGTNRDNEVEYRMSANLPGMELVGEIVLLVLAQQRRSG